MGNDKGKVVVATGPSRTATLAVMLLQRLLFVVLVSLASLPVAAWACSRTPVSLLEHLAKAKSVFVGRMEAERGDGSFDLRVEEAFKGDVGGKLVPVKLSVGKQCGFDKPRRGDRFLIFVYGDEPVTTVGGSSLIWAEANGAHLNPVEDTLATLRSLLAHDSTRPPSPLVPNAEAAIHRALEALLPAYGTDAIAKHKPLVAVELERKGNDEPAWRVTVGPLSVDVAKWSGSAKVTPHASVP